MTATPLVADAVASMAMPTSSSSLASALPTQPNLKKQDAANLDASKLTALTPEVVCAVFAR